MEFLVLLLTLASLPQAVTPQQAVDELLSADRAFSAAGVNKDSVIEQLTPMFAADVIMPVPGGKFAHGVAEAVTALRANPDNTTAKVDWAPIRGGISADGTQGFTFGYMTLRRPDGTTMPLKYMAYWVKTPAGWRVAAYKRARRPEGAVSTDMMPASLPLKFVAPNPSAVAAAEREVAAAEKAFSDESQTIGLGAAFVKYGLPDAVNIGGDAAFTVGNQKIGQAVGGDRPPLPNPLHWAADEKVIAASSGDLGVSIGFIYQNATPADRKTPPNAFFTIWRKVNGVWKYIAE